MERPANRNTETTVFPSEKESDFGLSHSGYCFYNTVLLALSPACSAQRSSQLPGEMQAKVTAQASPFYKFARIT